MTLFSYLVTVSEIQCSQEEKFVHAISYC